MTPYLLMRSDRPAFDFYQSVQGRARRTLLRAPYWASFVVTPAKHTLFIGLYSASLIGPSPPGRTHPLTDLLSNPDTDDLYVCELTDKMIDLAGRLLIDWNAGTRSWVQHASNHERPVLEITREFREPEFPGYLGLVTSLSELGEMPETWRVALANARGIYLLSCPRTFEQYVGMASGSGGFFSRWGAYLEDGHGGNVALKSRQASDYRVSILEVAGSAATTEEITAMESLWKRKLQSREMGLNRNG